MSPVHAVDMDVEFTETGMHQLVYQGMGKIYEFIYKQVLILGTLPR